ncbi:MAG: TRC40/GET3/ArsA family transport-energizing ATPase [Candidatus Aenigmatarchaeota archaeon]|nr:arsenical pump-driving ATPase GET3 [Nanoarchaeota archaeon]
MVLEKLKGKKNTIFYFFSGKGGVGKTSVAAATALHLSQIEKKKTLIISIDPAHSLSDSFESKIGGDVKKLKKNLFSLEIDPEKSLGEYKEKITPQIDKISFLKGSGLEDIFDIAGVTPGVDELAAFDKFLQYMNSDEYNVIIFDTAPTGHALRFLSLPDILDSWIGKMLKIRARFATMANVFKKIIPFAKEDESPSLGTEHLDEIKERIEQARKILMDPERTIFNIVMIPEQMSIFESEMLLKTLGEFKIPVKNVIVNQLIPNNPECKFCTEKRKIQQKRLEEIRKKFSQMKIKEISLLKEEVVGFDALEKIGKKLF